MVRVYLDRIEETQAGQRLAVLLLRLGDGDYLSWFIPLEWLPEGTQEGDWLQVQFAPDPEAKAQIRQEIDALWDELMRDE